MGNRDEMSGTGVVFSRNPSTGARGLFGEYLPVAQGEDLVSGVRTPQSIDALKSQMPDVYEELEGLSRDLEQHFHDMQDVEFTVESGNLFMLQTRSGKRSGQAAVKIAVDMVEDGLLTRNEALLRITPDDIRSLLHNRIQFPERHQAIARGLNAAPGAVSGRVVFDPLEAVSVAKTSGGVILVRPETSPDDIQGIAAAGGVLTSRGGLTSHAAIVTRAMGKPCVCGAEEVTVDLKDQSFSVGGTVVRKGDVITVDGSSGSVYQGALALLEAEATPELAKLLSWADETKQIGVWGNADTAEGVALAKKHGAEGIGLCRTERQFTGKERLDAIRDFILSDSQEQEEKALANLRKLQKRDFLSLFKALGDTPVIIRLLDLPLHEFLPVEQDTDDPKLKRRLEDLQEVNPMLGHRGVRLAVTTPQGLRHAGRGHRRGPGRYRRPRLHHGPSSNHLAGTPMGQKAHRGARLPHRHHDGDRPSLHEGRAPWPKRPASSPSAPTTSPRPSTPSPVRTPRRSSSPPTSKTASSTTTPSK